MDITIGNIFFNLKNKNMQEIKLMNEAIAKGEN